jgi:hypothetical protein
MDTIYTKDPAYLRNILDIRWLRASLCLNVLGYLYKDLLGANKIMLSGSLFYFYFVGLSVCRFVVFRNQFFFYCHF